MRVIVIVVVVIVVTGGKQSQLLAFALGLGWSLTKTCKTAVNYHPATRKVTKNQFLNFNLFEILKKIYCKLTQLYYAKVTLFF